MSDTDKEKRAQTKRESRARKQSSSAYTHNKNQKLTNKKLKKLFRETKDTKDYIQYLENKVADAESRQERIIEMCEEIGEYKNQKHALQAARIFRRRRRVIEALNFKCPFCGERKLKLRCWVVETDTKQYPDFKPCCRACYGEKYVQHKVFSATGETIRLIRTKLKLSQEQLAVWFGHTKLTILRWEKRPIIFLTDAENDRLLILSSAFLNACRTGS